eukprot:1018045-Amphidinium_carterae.1
MPFFLVSCAYFGSVFGVVNAACFYFGTVPNTTRILSGFCMLHLRTCDATPFIDIGVQPSGIDGSGEQKVLVMTSDFTLTKDRLSSSEQGVQNMLHPVAFSR